jgi:hypothetical protein
MELHVKVFIHVNLVRQLCMLVIDSDLIKSVAYYLATPSDSVHEKLMKCLLRNVILTDTRVGPQRCFVFQL